MIKPLYRRINTKKIAVLSLLLAVGSCSITSSVKAWDRFTTLQAGGVVFGIYAGYKILSGFVNWMCPKNEEDTGSVSVYRANQPGIYPDINMTPGDFTSWDEIKNYIESFAREPIFENVDFDRFVKHLYVDFKNHIREVTKAQVWQRMTAVRGNFVIEQVFTQERLYPDLERFDVSPNIVDLSPSMDYVVAHDLDQQERNAVLRQLYQLEQDLALLRDGRVPAGYAQGIDCTTLIDSVLSEMQNLRDRLS